jgi:hypothetical protein
MEKLSKGQVFPRMITSKQDQSQEAQVVGEMFSNYFLQIEENGNSSAAELSVLKSFQLPYYFREQTV